MIWRWKRNENRLQVGRIRQSRHPAICSDPPDGATLIRPTQGEETIRSLEFQNLFHKRDG
ncbi:hypothetical protein C8256_00640 [Kluyvera genomosp. 2]|uniref:Uncharacterized protein n=1 Tax=Kluyvera genomosp. 2 TaxID=2774054 RepID=A0A2T2Y7N1_9ENTR|nr:hypothetical protein C8256_00640 [Kluyvera genomosp. 2]